MFSERENLMVLRRSVREGRALKFALFEKGQMFGATYRRNASTYAEFLTNLNTLSDILLRFQKSELSLF